MRLVDESHRVCVSVRGFETSDEGDSFGIKSCRLGFVLLPCCL